MHALMTIEVATLVVVAIKVHFGLDWVLVIAHTTLKSLFFYGVIRKNI